MSIVESRNFYFFTPTLEKLSSVREILTSKGRTLAQGALAWIWARSGRTVPVPGFRSVAQAKENAAAMQKPTVTSADFIAPQAAPAAAATPLFSA